MRTITNINGLPQTLNSSIGLSWELLDCSYNPIEPIFRTPIMNKSRKYCTYYSGVPNVDISYAAMDTIFIATEVTTPSDWSSQSWWDIFLIGGATACGGYFGGANGGYAGNLIFGIQCDLGSSKPITTLVSPSGSFSPIIPTVDGIPITEDFKLKVLTKYRLEFYYKKVDEYAFIKVTEEISGGDEKVTKFEWNDISDSGGFNMQAGYVSLGCGSHVNTQLETWTYSLNNTGSIDSFLMWDTDISNIAMYDISKNGSLLGKELYTPYWVGL